MNLIKSCARTTNLRRHSVILSIAVLLAMLANIDETGAQATVNVKLGAYAAKPMTGYRALDKAIA
jgi:hypothetical protein